MPHCIVIIILSIVSREHLPEVNRSLTTIRWSGGVKAYTGSCVFILHVKYVTCKKHLHHIFTHAGNNVTGEKV